LELLVHRTKKGLEMEEVRFQPHQEIWRGSRSAFSGMGLDGSLLALNSALAIALSEPNATERYLKGEPVLDSARLDR
jgi:hypothetical protein